MEFSGIAGISSPDYSPGMPLLARSFMDQSPIGLSCVAKNNTSQT
jgi:hypothetical protein